MPWNFFLENKKFFFNRAYFIFLARLLPRVSTTTEDSELEMEDKDEDADEDKEEDTEYSKEDVLSLDSKGLVFFKR